MADSAIRLVHGPANPAGALVFVHGFTGGLDGTWERFPEWLIADARLRGFAAFSFGYDAVLEGR